MNFDHAFRKPDCRKCLDVGLVELQSGNVKMLAKCMCDIGRGVHWQLPFAPMQGFIENFVDVEQFKPKNNLAERIAWVIERAKTSEQFWAEHERQIKIAHSKSHKEF